MWSLQIVSQTTILLKWTFRICRLNKLGLIYSNYLWNGSDISSLNAFSQAIFLDLDSWNNSRFPLLPSSFHLQILLYSKLKGTICHTVILQFKMWGMPDSQRLSFNHLLSNNVEDIFEKLKIQMFDFSLKLNGLRISHATEMFKNNLFLI